MIEFIVTIQVILLTVFGILVGYLLLLSILALLEKKEKKNYNNTGDLRRFAVVVPAHNEESGIARTLQCLLNLDYPKHLFDVIVIADNCTDRTAAISEKEGALVMKRTNPDLRGKGYALRWCLDQLLNGRVNGHYDSVVIVDADTRVSENMLIVFNFYRSRGAEAIQGYFSVAPKPGFWTSETIRIGFTLFNYVRPMGRKKLGCTAGLRGNGMCFSSNVLKYIPWNAYSTTEDLEYAMTLLRNEINVVFAPDVIGYNQIPETADKAESQRERWEVGRFPVLKKFAGPLFMSGLKSLFRSGKRKHALHYFDAFVDLVTPPLVTMLLFILAMAGLSTVLWWAGIAYSLLFAGLWFLLFAMGTAHALTGLIAAGADKTMYKSLLYVPKYAFWKLCLYFKVLIRGRTSEWVRTARD